VTAPTRKRKPASRVTSALYALVLLPLAWFCGSWGWGYAEDWLWRADMWTSPGVVEAEVVDKEPWTTRPSKPEHHILSWAWTDEDGEHVGSQEVAPSTYERTEIGDPIRVFVDEGGRSIVPGFKDNGETLLVEGLYVGVLWLMALIFGMGGLGAARRVITGPRRPTP